MYNDSTAVMNENTEGKIYTSVQSMLCDKKRGIYKEYLSTGEAIAPNNYYYYYY